MSLTSRLVKLPLHMRVRKIEQSKISDQNRNQLQNYFVETVKLQNLENTNEDEPIPKSEEELVWQNEFKGLTASSNNPAINLQHLIKKEFLVMFQFHLTLKNFKASYRIQNLNIYLQFIRLHFALSI